MYGTPCGGQTEDKVVEDARSSLFRSTHTRYGLVHREPSCQLPDARGLELPFTSRFLLDCRFKKFWSNFGSFLKLGVVEQDPNAAKLMKLLRWESSADKNETTGLEGVYRRI